ncbi:molecular chaperone Tir [Carboxylicivirga sp. M1479]|uniref:molecular chaperone Tir n=2 Tax=Carboxylicivirga TaxID=1628153 RepID=UPI001177C164|nr:molecular chaperone Tir [Carboxylicivirga sp. M1479]TRX71282.1 molecular chaperone Tir [Carboxylicivirga sp. M1479]
MENNFKKVKNYLLELNCEIVNENETESILVVTKPDEGIVNLVLGCVDPLLIMEQFIFEINGDNLNVFKQLLMKNRDIVHGAFVLDETGRKVIFRDTLQIENLDLNELEGSINSLSLLLSEYANDIIKFSSIK